MTDIRAYLKTYDGPEVRLMEVCGTHTAQISRCGIPQMLSPKIRLISGPGCPVCVTVTAYIDRLVELSLSGETVLTFGDLMRVPGGGRQPGGCRLQGSHMSLNDAKAAGGKVRMVYSPMDTLKAAAADPAHGYIFAAVGFETTTPVYAMLLKEAESAGIRNLRLLTSLKTMPRVIGWICEEQGGIDGFLAPGHVSVVTGSAAFEPLAAKYGLPFVVSGFEGKQILESIYALVRFRGRAGVWNLYPSAVTKEGNRTAQKAVSHYFEPCDAAWRGMGVIPGSGMALREEFDRFDAGSAGLCEDHAPNGSCRCAQVLTGALSPVQCPLFGKACTPQLPQGACMVSQEGSCYNYFVSGRGAQ